MEQKHLINTKIIHPALLAMLIWILTSVTLGTGWFLYSVLFEANGDEWISISVTVCAGFLSLPVFIALCITIPNIKNSGLSPVGKIKRLLSTCFLCTLPYALIISCFYTGSYGNSNYLVSYLFYVLAISGVLFSCSVVAMLVTGRTIKKLFYAQNENEFLINQIGQQINS